MKQKLFMMVCGLMTAMTVGAQSLYEGFLMPPQEARPRVWRT